MQQIVQFLTSGGLFICSTYVEFVRWKHGEEHCAGYGPQDYYAIWLNVAFNASLLLSFVGVFKSNKRKPE